MPRIIRRIKREYSNFYSFEKEFYRELCWPIPIIKLKRLIKTFSVYFKETTAHINIPYLKCMGNLSAEGVDKDMIVFLKTNVDVVSVAYLQGSYYKAYSCKPNEDRSLVKRPIRIY